jgi:type VI secretion system protein ImpC
MSPEMRFEVEFGNERRGAQRKRKESMRILVVGDLMGARAGEAPPIDRRPIVGISVETFDEVLARFKPFVALPALGLQAPLSFVALDDFHPDQLFEKVATFDRYRALRQRLQNPSTFRAAADELRSDAPAQPSPSSADSRPVPTGAPGEKTGALLDRLLGTTPRLPSTARESTTARGSNESRTEAGVEAYIRSLVAPHIVAADDPQLPQFLSAVDAAITDTMRSLLHDAALQRLEATWRGVQWLLAGTGEIDEGELEVSLLHLTREELGVQAHPDSALELRLEARGADATPWSLVVADFAFGPSEGDMETLRGLGRLLSGLGIPLVAAAQGALVGCEDVRVQADSKSWTRLPVDVARLWAEVRTMPEGRWLGLTWPRIILRLPYGKKTDPVDAFEFEEMPADHAHEDYLWGNGAFAAALTMVRTYLGESDGLEGDIGDLPAFTYMEHGEPTLKPCAEFCMTERAAEETLARGIMPLVSYRNRNAVRLIRLQSIVSGE